MRKARRAPARCATAEAIREEVLAALGEFSRKVTAMEAAGRRRDVRVRKVETRQTGTDSILIAINESIGSLGYHLKTAVETQAAGVKTYVGDQLRTLASEHAALASRIHELEEARYGAAVGLPSTPHTNGKT